MHAIWSHDLHRQEVSTDVAVDTSVDCPSTYRSIYWPAVGRVAAKCRSLYGRRIDLNDQSTVGGQIGRDSIGSVSAIYRWAVGQVSVTFRWCTNVFSAGIELIQFISRLCLCYCSTRLKACLQGICDLIVLVFSWTLGFLYYFVLFYKVHVLLLSLSFSRCRCLMLIVTGIAYPLGSIQTWGTFPRRFSDLKLTPQ